MVGTLRFAHPASRAACLADFTISSSIGFAGIDQIFQRDARHAFAA